jgi:cation diffusion facilitator CzcD-associated flavoprotein CzcO
MSGVGFAAMLRRAGHENFTIYEKADEVGGTWRENRYPGLSCDVPARYYSYSWAPNPDWTHAFSPGPEIHDYFISCSRKFGLRDRIRFGTKITEARWEDGRWLLTTEGGETEEADVFITATGFLHQPRIPEIEGIGEFGGRIFHSARWDDEAVVDGTRVGVIGNGSTGVQIVTELAERASALTMFQRSAQWTFPMPNHEYSSVSKRIFHRSPRLNRLSYRLNQRFLESTFGEATVKPGIQRRWITAVCKANLRRIKDPELRRKLTPDHEPMCRRLIMSSGFYDAIQKPGVELVTDAIDRIEPEGVRTADGRLHELDVIVLATGFDFHAHMRPMKISGANGATLDEAWANGPRAYRTIAMPGFPNFFMLLGPHSPVGNHSLVAVLETQGAYVLDWINRLRRGEIAATAPTAEATDRFNDEMKAAMPNTIWTSGCTSWYLGPDGRPELWPWTPQRFREMLERPDVAEYEVATSAS